MENPEEIFGNSSRSKQIDARGQLENIGMDEDEIEWRKDFLDIDDEDAERLAGMRDLLAANREEVAEQFYDNLQQYDQTMEILESSSRSVESLKKTQGAYLVTLADGEYGEEYVRNRARIGKLHDMIDMPLKHYIGQYGVYYN